MFDLNRTGLICVEYLRSTPASYGDYSDRQVIATEEPACLDPRWWAPSWKPGRLVMCLGPDDLLCALAPRNEVRVWAGKAFRPINPPMSAVSEFLARSPKYGPEIHIAGGFTTATVAKPEKAI